MSRGGARQALQAVPGSGAGAGGGDMGLIQVLPSEAVSVLLQLLELGHLLQVGVPFLGHGTAQHQVAQVRHAGQQAV